MSQTRGKQLSSRERLLAVLGVAGVVLLVLFLYRPVAPRPVFEDLAELAPLPDSFAVYQQRRTGDAFALYDAGQYDRFIDRVKAEISEPTQLRAAPRGPPQRRRLQPATRGRFRRFSAGRGGSLAARAGISALGRSCPGARRAAAPFEPARPPFV